MAYDIHKLNADLKKALDGYKPKERITFHKGDQIHEKTAKQKNRDDRRACKRNLKRGEWD